MTCGLEIFRVIEIKLINHTVQFPHTLILISVQNYTINNALYITATLSIL